MNRNEKDSRRKKKRAEKQRAARGGSIAPVQHRPTPTQELVSQDDMIAQMDGMLAPYAAPISDAISVDPSSAAKVASDAMDQRIANAWARSEQSPACRKGCSYCCRGVRVDVSPPEVARILGHISTRMTEEERTSIMARASENAGKTHGATLLGYPARLPCALLSDAGECLVYDARPLACRNEHSLDADACRIANEQDGNGTEGQQIPHAFMVYAAGGLYVTAMSKAMRDRGLNAAPLELQEALHVGLTNPSAIADWLAGTDPFAPARSNQTGEEGAFIPDTLPRRSLPIL